MVFAYFGVDDMAPVAVSDSAVIFPACHTPLLLQFASTRSSTPNRTGFATGRFICFAAEPLDAAPFAAAPFAAEPFAAEPFAAAPFAAAPFAPGAFAAGAFAAGTFAAGAFAAEPFATGNFAAGAFAAGTFTAGTSTGLILAIFFAGLSPQTFFILWYFSPFVLLNAWLQYRQVVLSGKSEDTPDDNDPAADDCCLGERFISVLTPF
jgi:hypothetical protein